MSEKSEQEVLETYKSAKQNLDLADDELFKVYEPLMIKAVGEGRKAAEDLLMRVPESYCRFRLWRMLGHG